MCPRRFRTGWAYFRRGDRRLGIAGARPCRLFIPGLVAAMPARSGRAIRPGRQIADDDCASLPAGVGDFAHPKTFPFPHSHDKIFAENVKIRFTSAYEEHACASTAATAVMLTMPRAVTDGVSTWAGCAAPIRIGPTGSASANTFVAS